ncbi:MULTISPECIES: hypothetical protein [unclassified Micromonospora]|uniref:hypothetical protein n=1 Tax=unclassified Micromonospora TaxID=2617518 RepID=UPI0011828E68|nr:MULTISPECIES: hypothetical protein [unclassified Micromonospora]
MRQLRPRNERWLSACLFGNQHKLELLGALASAVDGRINLTEVARIHGVAPAVYYAPVKDLMGLGLLDRIARVPGDRRQWYQRCGSEQVWAAIGSLVHSLRDFVPATSQTRGPAASVSTT